VLCAVVVFVYCAIHAFDPPRLNWGDPGSDYNVMTAGRNFQQYGFLKLHLTPHLLDAASMTPADRALIYAPPQLPDLVTASARRVRNVRARAVPARGAVLLVRRAVLRLRARRRVLVAADRRTRAGALGRESLWISTPTICTIRRWRSSSAPEACTSCRGISARTRPAEYAVLSGVFLFLAFRRRTTSGFWCRCAGAVTLATIAG
jgi:hypothetical protein